MNARALTRISFLSFCVALYGCASVPFPSQSSISAIEICSGRHDCNNGKFKIEDIDSINQAIDALHPFQHGWKTESQMALTTGWFTYPTPEDKVLFRDREGKAVVVIWFGPGWMGTAVYEGGARVKYFRKTMAEEVRPLRQALRITLHSTGPAQKAAQAG